MLIDDVLVLDADSQPPELEAETLHLSLFAETSTDLLPAVAGAV